MTKAERTQIGDKFNLLTVIENPFKKDSRYFVKCKCDCGNEVITRLDHIYSGNTKGCGCQKSVPKRGNLRHGLCGTRIYRIHSRMFQRCFNPNYPEFSYYGGRGIAICKEWLGKEGFLNFYDWAMANGYSDDLTIDRIDVNGNYEPDNCRWATPKEQGCNKRNNIRIEINGRTKTLPEWCEEYDFDYGLAQSRYYAGWKPNELFIPKGTRRSRQESIQNHRRRVFPSSLEV